MTCFRNAPGLRQIAWPAGGQRRFDLSLQDGFPILGEAVVDHGCRCDQRCLGRSTLRLRLAGARSPFRPVRPPQHRFRRRDDKQELGMDDAITLATMQGNSDAPSPQRNAARFGERSHDRVTLAAPLMLMGWRDISRWPRALLRWREPQETDGPARARTATVRAPDTVGNARDAAIGGLARCQTHPGTRCRNSRRPGGVSHR